jgi:hypothetical protein
MTEAKWLACREPRAMLDAIKERVPVRKMRLVGAACCRRIQHLFHDPACHRGVEVAERYADGEVTDDELFDAGRTVGMLKEGTYTLGGLPTLWLNRPAVMSGHAVLELLETDARLLVDGSGTVAYRAEQAAFDGAYEKVGTRDLRASKKGQSAQKAERTAQVRLIRDVFGNAFRPVTLSPAWRTDTAVSLAKQMYELRDFSSMPILADALQDAGCDSDDVLNHCRGPEPHVRGCWVVDLVLEKS